MSKLCGDKKSDPRVELHLTMLCAPYQMDLNQLLKLVSVITRGDVKKVLASRPRRPTYLYHIVRQCAGLDGAWPPVFDLIRGLDRADLIPTLRDLIRDERTEVVLMFCRAFKFGPADVDAIGMDRLFGGYPPTIKAMKIYFEVSLIPYQVWAATICDMYVLAEVNRAFGDGQPFAIEYQAEVRELVRLAVVDVVILGGADGRDKLRVEISRWICTEPMCAASRRKMLDHFLSAL